MTISKDVVKVADKKINSFMIKIKPHQPSNRSETPQPIVIKGIKISTPVLIALSNSIVVYIFPIISITFLHAKYIANKFPLLCVFQ